MAMRGKPSARTTKLPQSAIRHVMTLARELNDVVHLEVGEPAENTPAPIIQRALSQALAGHTKYVPNAGGWELRQLVAERYSRRIRRAIDPDRVIITTGGVGAVFTAMTVCLDEHDEVLLPDPGWPNYCAMAVLLGARVRTYPLRPEHEFEPDPAELAACITPATRAVVVNTPANPTGAVFSPSAVRAIADTARAHNLYLISDEIYEDLVFEGHHHSFLAEELDDRLWVASGVSKSFAMTGWRIGWLIAPPNGSGFAATVQEPLASCVSSISQSAAFAALSEYPEYPRTLAEVYQGRRDLLVSQLRDTGLLTAIPHGAFYALLDVSAYGLSSMDAALALLKRHRVAVVPGFTFGPGSDRFLRVAFTTTEERLEIGCKRIKSWVDSLKN